MKYFSSDRDHSLDAPRTRPFSPPRFSRRRCLSALALGALLSLGVSTPAAPPTDIPARVEALLAQMTPEEKIAQLCGAMLPPKPLGTPIEDAELATLLKNGIGTIGPMDVQSGIDDDVALKNRLQQFARTQTRLGIPILFHSEAAHGLMNAEATSFPMPIGLACTWNESLTQQIYDATAREMHARGNHVALTPIIDVARDPRWGRVEETLGEDPVLVGRLGAAMVRGLQGSDSGVTPGHVGSTLKHLVGHGASEGGLNQSPAQVGPNELRQVHLAPFAHVIRHAAPAAIMPSYNEVDGIPSHANRPLLQDIVRGHLDFKGLYISDYGGISMLLKHGVAATSPDAARLALDTGVQMEVSTGVEFPTLVNALADDAPLRAQVDAAVRAVLTLKFSLGLFDAAPAQATAARALVNSPAHHALALDAARQSIVLLQNDRATLPLDAAKLKRVAVIGPNAAITRLGGYSGTPVALPSLLEKIRARVGPATTVVHAEGCKITARDERNAYLNWKQDDTALADPAENQRLIADARATAAGSDVIILVLGDNETTTRESWGNNHLGDRSSLELPGDQVALARALFDTGIPVVVYLMHGRPFALGDIPARAAALIDGWYAGQATAQAATEILFGDTNPSGKLAISIPFSSGQTPTYYSKKPHSATYGYLFEPTGALYPFGHGLSYTTFTYGPPQLAQARTPVGAQNTLNVTVTNTGSRAGDEIVQLYVRDEVSLPTRPRLELRDFARVHLAPGESTTVNFPLTEETLGAYDETMRLRAEPGWFTLTVGPSSATGQSVRLELLSANQP